MRSECKKAPHLVRNCTASRRHTHRKVFHNSPFIPHKHRRKTPHPPHFSHKTAPSFHRDTLLNSTKPQFVKTTPFSPQTPSADALKSPVQTQTNALRALISLPIKQAGLPLGDNTCPIKRPTLKEGCKTFSCLRRQHRLIKKQLQSS